MGRAERGREQSGSVGERSRCGRDLWGHWRSLRPGDAELDVLDAVCEWGDLLGQRDVRVRAGLDWGDVP